MDARLNLYGNTIAAKIAKHVNSAGAVVTSSSLPAATQELVKTPRWCRSSPSSTPATA